MKKIPDNAKKVFEGVLHDVYQWEQELFDGSKATFECIKRGDSTSVVAVSSDKIVIIKEEQPGKPIFNGLPGGRVEKNESQVDAAERELLEETGFSTENIQEWFIEDPAKMSKFEWNIHYFVAKDCKKIQELKLDPGEKIETRLVSFDEFLEMRDELGFKGGDFLTRLEKATESEEEKQKLKTLLGITT